jgi:hypothetical protein
MAGFDLVTVTVVSSVDRIRIEPNKWVMETTRTRPYFITPAAFPPEKVYLFLSILSPAATTLPLE